MILDISVRHVATEDLSKLVLIRASDMRIRRLILEFDAVRLGAPHDVLLLLDLQSFPLHHLVFALLQQQHRAGGAGNSFGQQSYARSIEQRRILRAVDEPGKIAIVLVRPTRRFFSQRGLPCKVTNNRARHIEDNVVRAAGEPHHRIVLRARHHESFNASDLFVEARHARWSVIRNKIAPELRPKPDHEVHSSRGGPRFTDGGDCGRELLALLCVQNVELQVSVRGGSQSKDSSLRCVHARIISSTVLANKSRPFFCVARAPSPANAAIKAEPDVHPRAKVLCVASPCRFPLWGGRPRPRMPPIKAEPDVHRWCRAKVIGVASPCRFPLWRGRPRPRMPASKQNSMFIHGAEPRLFVLQWRGRPRPRMPAIEVVPMLIRRRPGPLVQLAFSSSRLRKAAPSGSV